jgi:hypothetical protein
VTGSRNRAFVAAGVMATVAVVAVALYSPYPVLHEETFKNLAFVALPVFLGVGVRDRRRYIAAIHERAERAEATREEEACAASSRSACGSRARSTTSWRTRWWPSTCRPASRRTSSTAGPRRPRTALTEIKRVSGAALADLRATLGVLREADAPAPVRPAQGLEALEEMAGRVRAAGVDVTIETRRGTRTARPIPSALEAAAYRIAQEALTNVLRHAGARRATVRRRGPRRRSSSRSSTTGGGERGRRRRGPRRPRHARARGRRRRLGRRRAAGGRAGWRVHARLPMPVAGRVA